MSQIQGSAKLGSAAQLRGWWKFEDGAGTRAADSIGEGHLCAVGEPGWTHAGRFGGAVALDGATQWLGAPSPVIRTDRSFSVAAWVRLDRATLKGELRFGPDEYARTALSLDSPTHSPFYLGIRAFPEVQPDGTTRKVARWNFTVSPSDGSVEQRMFEWQHAAASQPIDVSALDRWVLLVGVCDIPGSAARLYVNGVADRGLKQVPERFTFWRADGGLQIGRARWLGRIVDQWPGSIGAVRVFEGVLSEADAGSLYAQDAGAGA